MTSTITDAQVTLGSYGRARITGNDELRAMFRHASECGLGVVIGYVAGRIGNATRQLAAHGSL